MPEDIKQNGTITAGDTSPEALARMAAEAAEGATADEVTPASTSNTEEKEIKRGSPTDAARGDIYKAARGARDEVITKDEEEVPGIKEANGVMNAAAAGDEKAQESGSQDASSIVEHPSSTKDVDARPGMTKIVLNGVERYYPNSVVEEHGGVTAYQKLLLAEHKLNHVADQQRQVNEAAQTLAREGARISQREASLNQLEATLRQREASLVPPATSADARKDEGADKQLAAEIAGKLYSGDESAATEAIEALLRKTRAAGDPVTPDLIAATVKAELDRNRAEQAEEQRKQRERDAQAMVSRDKQEANEVWKSEYRDLAVDPDMVAVVGRRVQQLQQLPENSDKSLVQLTRLAGEEARKKFAPRNELADRRAVKALTPSLNSNGADLEQPGVVKKKTGTDIVNEERKRRGYPPL